MNDIKLIQDGAELSLRRQLVLTAKLSAPAIMAQLSTILMQYIDASMVGRLGAGQSASVGLMNSSLWMFWGVCSTITMGFSVQVAHRLGAKDTTGARTVLRQGIAACAIAGTVIALIGIAISGALPRWLGGTEGRRQRHTGSERPSRTGGTSCRRRLSIPAPQYKVRHVK